MRMHTQQRQDVVILTPMEKNIDASIQEEFRNALHETIEQGRRRLVLDLSHVQFLDSSGLGVMVSALKKMGDDGELAFCGVQEQVSNVFSLTRLDRVFNIYPNNQEACKALCGPEDGPDSEGVE